MVRAADLHGEIVQNIGPPAAQQTWQTPTGHQLWLRAKEQAGCAAGLDGWTGNEVYMCTEEMWDVVADFFSQGYTLGLLPTEITCLRQCHLPKEGKGLRQDGARDVWSLRPISISSVLWRTWTSTLRAQDEVQQWLRGWAPEEAYAGKKDTDVLAAVINMVNKMYVCCIFTSL